MISFPHTLMVHFFDRSVSLVFKLRRAHPDRKKISIKTYKYLNIIIFIQCKITKDQTQFLIFLQSQKSKKSKNTDSTKMCFKKFLIQFERFLKILTALHMIYVFLLNKDYHLQR